MGDGLLLLAWKNHNSTFSHVISTLREKGQYTDVTVACDGKFYPAHKIVLSACSQYFEEMLQNTPCKHPIIVLKDISSRELDALLHYMYAGEVSVSQKNLTELIKAAESLQIKGLAVPDELVPSNASDIKNSHASPDGGIDPPAKRQRRERDNTPERETHAYLNRLTDSSPTRDNRLPSHNSENRPMADESDSAPFVKTEPSSLPSSPQLQGNEMGEQATVSITLTRGGREDEGHFSPEATRVRRRSVTNFPNQDSYEPTYNIKEEAVDSDTVGSAQDLSFSPPPAGTTSISPLGTSNSTPLGGSKHIENQMRILFNSPKRRESLHSESTVFHAAGPSGLLPNLSVTSREGYRPATESYSSKTPPEGYPTLPSHISTSPVRVLLPTATTTHVPVGGGGGSSNRAHSTPEACSLQQSRENDDDKIKGSEGQDQLGVGQPQKTFSCSYCQYSSFSYTMYVQHMRIHTGEKPFACSFCSFRSGRKSVVTKHVKTQHSSD